MSQCRHVPGTNCPSPSFVFKILVISLKCLFHLTNINANCQRYNSNKNMSKIKELRFANEKSRKPYISIQGLIERITALHKYILIRFISILKAKNGHQYNIKQRSWFRENMQICYERVTQELSIYSIWTLTDSEIKWNILFIPYLDCRPNLHQESSSPLGKKRPLAEFETTRNRKCMVSWKFETGNQTK